MQVNESRVNSRGPLIAVIKIQLNAGQIDRIFLHQNDDEYLLAEEFQKRHNLNPELIQHIQQRIRLSRQSIRRDQTHRSSVTNQHEVKPDRYSHAPSQLSTHKQNNSVNKQGAANTSTTPFQRIKCCTPVQSDYKPIQAAYNEQNLIDKPLETELKNQKQKIRKIENKGAEIDNLQNYGRQYFYEQQSFANRPPTETESQQKFGYSFDESKPSRVKIITKQQMSELRSSIRSLSKSEKSRITKEVTSRLYNESEIKKNYLNRIKSKAQITKQEQKDMEELTLHPKINKVSEMIVEGQYGQIPIENLLLSKLKDISIKKEKQIAEKQKEQLNRCSFQPAINEISKKLTRDRSMSSFNSQTHQCLRHTTSRQQFRPSLNKVSSNIVEGKGKKFEERNKQYLERKNSKLNKLLAKKIQSQKVDKNGQKMFQPSINQPKPHIRDLKNNDIYDHLYLMSKRTREYVAPEPIPKINGNSQTIVEQMHVKRLAWLFSELDSDHDGMISAKKININTISQEILEVIMPVLFEMEEMNIQLNLSDFRKAIHNLHNSLNSLQKNTLYNYSHGQKQ